MCGSLTGTEPRPTTHKAGTHIYGWTTKPETADQLFYKEICLYTTQKNLSAKCCFQHYFLNVHYIS